MQSDGMHGLELGCAARTWVHFINPPSSAKQNALFIVDLTFRESVTHHLFSLGGSLHFDLVYQRDSVLISPYAC